MHSHLVPYDANSPGQRSRSFPTSCALGSVSFSDEYGESSSGRNFPSTGMIPILLFDSDGDADDLLWSDPASLPLRFGVVNGTRTEEDGSSPGYRAVQDPYSGVLLELGAVESSAVRGPPGEQSPTRGGKEPNLSNGSHRLPHLAFNPVDSEPSGSADNKKGDDREKDISLFLDAGYSRSHCCCCCSSSSRSSSLGCLSQASSLRTPGGQSIRGTCYGSCGASPAAINTAELIAAAKKRKQDFALETFGPQIGWPSSNSIVLYDCVEHLQYPLTLYHDHDLSNQQQDAYAASSSAEDLSIEFLPRDRTMARGMPPSHSPTIESSSSSSSHLSLPRHLAWLQNITISLYIDQEGFRAVLPSFRLVGYTNPTLPIHSSRAGMQKLLAGGNDGNTGSTSIKQLSGLMDQASTDPDLSVNLDVGMAEFMPLKRESFVFHHSTLDTPPLIRRLSVNGDESRDYLSQHACLTVKSVGGFQIYVVRGSEVRRGSGGEDTASRTEGVIGSSPIKLEWRFEYTVEDKRKADGTKAGGGEKFLTPLRFSCSPGLLHPRQARKVTVLSVWKKSIQPKVVAGKVEPPIKASPTTSEDRARNFAGLASSPTSPKGVGVGVLRFPTPSKLWGKRTKSSPYQFDKGGDGSEEELLLSEDSADRRRRPRSTSAYASRVSQEAERALLGWGGQSTDVVRPAGRDARPATAGAERRGISKARSVGRGATSEGENERVFSRSQGGQSTPWSVYSRRPRTAR